MAKRNGWAILAALAVMLALMTAVAPGYGETDADRLFHDGVACYLRGDLAAARVALEAALRQAPAHANARQLLDEVNGELRRVTGPAAPAAMTTAAAAPVAVSPVAVMPVAVARAGVSEGRVALGPLAAAVPTAAAVPPQTLAPMLTERLVLRGEAVPAGVKALAGIEVYSEGGALKLRLSTSGNVDIMDAKSYQPPMVMIDLLGCKDALPNRALQVGAGALVRVRHLRQRTEPMETTRVILDLNRLTPYTVERVPGGVVVTFPGTTGLAAPLALGEPPYFRPGVTALTPLTSYRVQSQWLRLLAGEKQQGPVGTLLAKPMGVLVTDAAGVPLANVPVWFTVTENDGCFRGANGELTETVRVLSDAQGQALVDGYTYSRLAGDNVVTASLVEGGAGVTFLHTAVPGEAVEVVKIHGDEQEGQIESELDQPLVVEVRDRFANPVAGQRVIFTVLYNDGTADVNPNRYGTQSVVVTDEHGRARLEKFKLGSRRGRNQVRASILTSDRGAAHGGLLIRAGGDRAVQPEYNGEAVRLQATQDHVALFVEEMLRELPGSADVDALQVYALDGMAQSGLKDRLASTLRSVDGVTFYDEGNAIYIGPGAGTDLEALENKLRALSPQPLLRKLVRSVLFTEYGRPQMISVDFRDAAVPDVIRTLAEIAGWNVVFPDNEDDLFEKQVTIHLLEVPAKDVLDNILKQCGYMRVENNGIIRIVSLDAAASQELRVVRGNSLDSWEGEEDEVINAFIPVHTRKPSELAELIKPMVGAPGELAADDGSQNLVVTDRVANVRRIMEVVKVLDNSTITIQQNMQVRVVELQHIDPERMATTLSALFGGWVKTGRPNEQVDNAELTTSENKTQQTMTWDFMSGYTRTVTATTHTTDGFLALPFTNNTGLTDNRLLLICPKPLLDKVMEIVTQFDSAPSLADNLVVKIVTLTNMDAATMITHLNTLYQYMPETSKSIGFKVIELGASDEASSAYSFFSSSSTAKNYKILLMVPKADEELVMGLIKQLDVSDAAGKEVLVMAVNRVTPTEMVSLLRTIYPSITAGAASSGSMIVAIVPKALANEVHAVVAKTDADMQMIVDSNMKRE
ncbi:MAG TPA: AMIN domain-containing protein, partial [bacterium]|nr:AMIN domain-containing protein [bacterium]